MTFPDTNHHWMMGDQLLELWEYGKEEDFVFDPNKKLGYIPPNRRFEPQIKLFALPRRVNHKVLKTNKTCYCCNNSSNLVVGKHTICWECFLLQRSFLHQKSNLGYL